MRTYATAASTACTALLLSSAFLAPIASGQNGQQVTLDSFRINQYWVPSPDTNAAFTLDLHQRQGQAPSSKYVQALLDGSNVKNSGNGEQLQPASVPNNNPTGDEDTCPGGSPGGPIHPANGTGGAGGSGGPNGNGQPGGNNGAPPNGNGNQTAPGGGSSQPSSSSTPGGPLPSGNSTSPTQSSSSLPSGSATSSSASTSATNSAAAANEDVDLIQVGQAEGLVFSVEVDIGGTTYELVLDTGSSDTWVVNQGFQCQKPGTGDVQAQSACQFGAVFSGASSFTQLPNLNFHVTYTDGEALTGIFGTDTVSVAGIEVKNQQIALVNTAAWNGDGVSSGILGLAFPGATKAFSGTDYRFDTTSNQVVYNPVFTSMYQQGSVSPLFSIALDRNQGGKIAFGGLPPVAYNGTFASAPMQLLTTSSSNIQGTASSSTYTLYSITTNGLFYENSNSSQWSYANYPSPFEQPNDSTQLQALVDTGQSLIYLPSGSADAVNNLFNPAPKYKDNSGRYVVDCASTPPEFGVEIGQQTFYINPKDMVVNLGGQCVSAVAATGNGGSSVLGHPFLKNVLAVFDVGAQVMRFAAREDY